MACKIYTQFTLLCLVLPIFARFPLSPTSVSYPGIGSFQLGELPSDHYLPASPESIEPKFMLYTRENPDEAELLPWNNTDAIQESKYL